MRTDGSAGDADQTIRDWLLRRWELMTRLGIGGFVLLVIVGLALAVLVAYEVAVVWKVLSEQMSLEEFRSYVPVLEATAIAGLTFGLGLLHAEELVQEMEEE